MARNSQSASLSPPQQFAIRSPILPRRSASRAISRRQFDLLVDDAEQVATQDRELGVQIAESGEQRTEASLTLATRSGLWNPGPIRIGA